MSRFSVDQIIKAWVEVRAEGVVADYKADMTISQLSRKWDWSRESIYRHLQREGVYTRPGKSGPPNRERCQRDHDPKHWKPIPGRPHTRYCSECKRERERVGS